MAEMGTVAILWDFKQEGKLRYLEWMENGKTKMKKVTEEFYQSIKARVAQPKQDIETDFSFLD